MPTWPQRILITIYFAAAILIGTAGCFQAVINTFNFPYTYTDDWWLRYLVAPVIITLGFSLGLIAHELGHALTARALGDPVHRIQIGSGRRICTIHFAGFVWAVHQFPAAGAAHHGLRSEKNGRWHMWLITAGGPAVSLLILFPSYFFARHMMHNSLFLMNDRLLMSAFVAWTMGNLILLPGYILPGRYKLTGQVVQTDMLRLITLPFRSDEQIKAVITYSRLLQRFDLDELSPDAVWVLAEKRPDDLAALGLAEQVLRARDDARALKVQRKIIDLPNLDRSQRLAQIDSFLTSLLDLNAVGNYPEALAFAEELVASAPDDPSLQGTRGSVLIDLGREKEGEAILRKLQDSTDPITRSYSNIFLTLVCLRADDIASAIRHAQVAREAKSDCPCLKRLSDPRLVR